MGPMEAILLGALQGVTEFVPVSSSGHLVFAQHLLGVDQPGITLEICVHFGTLLAILVVFARPLWETARDGVLGARLVLRGERDLIAEQTPLFPTAVAVVVGTLPVAFAGVLLGHQVERLFASMVGAGAFLCVTGLVLAASRLAAPGENTEVGVARGALIGVAQAFALLPGISRSGITIVAARFTGLDGDRAARFSFVLAAPALLGASVWELMQAMNRAGSAGSIGDPELATFPLVLATVVAAVVGYASLRALLRIVRRGRLHWIALYCLPVGLFMIAVGGMGGG